MFSLLEGPQQSVPTAVALESDSMEMPMFSLSEGPQQSAPVALAAAAPAAEAMTNTRFFPDVSSKGVAEAPTSLAGAAPAAVPAAAPATGGTVFPTTSVGGRPGRPLLQMKQLHQRRHRRPAVLFPRLRVVCWSGVIGRCSGGGTVDQRYYCP